MLGSQPWLLLLALLLAPVPNDVAQERVARLDWPETAGYQAELKALYEASENRLLWVQNGRVTDRALQAIEMLQNADAKGLNSIDYDGPQWVERLSRLGHECALAHFDAVLSVSVMHYVSDLHYGRVDPGLYRLGPDTAARRSRLPYLVREHVLRAKDLQRGIEELEPPFEGYRRTVQAMQQYRSLLRADDREILLPRTAQTVEPGQYYPGTRSLIRLLQKLGDLAPDADLPLHPELYSGSIVEAVKRYQGRHGLDADGRIGKATLAQLNTPLIRRVRQLELTLERWRWIPHEFPQPPIVVNLPEFRLRAYNSSYRPELDMKIVAGKAQRHKTPVFSGELKYVIFRPYWNVPLSIQRAELVPQIRRDPSYLTKNNYEVITSEGAVVSSEPVTERLLAHLRSGRLSLRQTPGPDNALGLVKFIFPNEYNMYLHDTPARALFDKSRRDFSHGCMRVEKAVDLAAWVLQDEPEWSRERIAAAMNGSETIQVNLRRPIPVLVVYGTAVALEGGEVRFFEDIYAYDAILEKYLAERSVQPHSTGFNSPACEGNQSE